MICECGNNRFYVYPIQRPTNICDENGEFVDAYYEFMGDTIDHYECTVCSKEYDEEEFRSDIND